MLMQYGCETSGGIGEGLRRDKVPKRPRVRSVLIRFLWCTCARAFRAPVFPHPVRVGAWGFIGGGVVGGGRRLGAGSVRQAGRLSAGLGVGSRGAGGTDEHGARMRAGA